jgi:hypothetical protein
MKIDIRIDDLASEVSQSIVLEHMAGMLAITPIELEFGNRLSRFI